MDRAEQVGLAGQGVVQVDMGGEANMVHMGGWMGHMAMSTVQVYMGRGEGAHLGVL